jgi:hypothetical protein
VVAEANARRQLEEGRGREVAAVWFLIKGEERRRKNRSASAQAKWISGGAGKGEGQATTSWGEEGECGSPRGEERRVGGDDARRGGRRT